MTMSLFLNFGLLLLSLDHMSHESGRHLGLEHHRHHNTLGASKTLCIQQVLNEYLLKEPSPPSPSYLTTCPVSSAECPSLWVFLSAQALPFCPSLWRDICTPFPNVTNDVLAPHVGPSTAPPPVLCRSHSLDGSSVQSKSWSELICSSKPVTSPLFRNCVLLILIYLSGQQSDQLCL